MLALLFLLLPFVAAFPAVDLGVLLATTTSAGVTRYSLKYATAKRWASPIMSTRLSPSNVSSPAALPLPCPQSGLDPSQFSEDCLDLVLYVPPTAKLTPGGVPTIVWVHGGSFIVGSATGPGLDGSNLAVGTNAVVAVVQYRLGALGLLPPSSSSATSNLAIQDLMTALKFLHKFLPSLGGSPHTPRLTLAGQSSGASLVRALLGMPEAASLFSSAWLHSDPLNYGFLTAPALATLRTAWLKELGCESSDRCAQDMDVPTLLSHQSELFNAAPALGPEFFPFAPIRPSGEFIPHRLTQSQTFPASDARKPLVVSTVRDEATPTTYSLFPDTLTAGDFEPIVASLLGPSRTADIVASQFYRTDATDVRVTLQTLGTDEVWRCATWRLARQWAPARAFVGVFTRGVTYPLGNELCPPLGAVCHQDDIMVLFGTGGQESGAVRALTHELQARYAAFVRSGTPNAPGLAAWGAVGSGANVVARDLGGAGGGKGVFPAGACEPGFWGEKVPFDYQMLGE